jgi:hypothetical protein
VKAQVHCIEEGALSTATDKKNSPGVLFKEPEHLKRCGDKKAKAKVAAKVKDEKHRLLLLLQLDTEEWEPLDADVKAHLVDFYYEEEKREVVWVKEEKKREREEKREAVEEKREEKKREREEKREAGGGTSTERERERGRGRRRGRQRGQRWQRHEGREGKRARLLRARA